VACSGSNAHSCYSAAKTTGCVEGRYLDDSGVC